MRPGVAGLASAPRPGYRVRHRPPPNGVPATSSASTVRFQETASPVARAASPIGEQPVAIGDHGVDRDGERLGVRRHHSAVDAVADELGDAARIVCTVSTGLPDFIASSVMSPMSSWYGNEGDEVRARVMRQQLVVGQPSDEADPRIALAPVRAGASPAGPSPAITSGTSVRHRRYAANSRSRRFAPSRRLAVKTNSPGSSPEALEVGRMRHDLDRCAGRKVVRRAAPRSARSRSNGAPMDRRVRCDPARGRRARASGPGNATSCSPSRLSGIRRSARSESSAPNSSGSAERSSCGPLQQVR